MAGGGGDAKSVLQPGSNCLDIAHAGRVSVIVDAADYFHHVRQAMLKLGADPAQVDGRIASLSDAELMQVQGELDRLPAGGVLAVVGLVFVVLLVLELAGVIDIFKRT